MPGPSLFGPYRSESRLRQTLAEIAGGLALAALTVAVLFLVGSPS